MYSVAGGRQRLHRIGNIELESADQLEHYFVQLDLHRCQQFGRGSIVDRRLTKAIDLPKH